MVDANGSIAEGPVSSAPAAPPAEEEMVGGDAAEQGGDEEAAMELDSKGEETTDAYGPPVSMNWDLAAQYEAAQRLQRQVEEGNGEGLQSGTDLADRVPGSTFHHASARLTDCYLNRDLCSNTVVLMS